MSTVLYGNMKDGVGKTTNSIMTMYQLARKGYKTLVCDSDPQASVTQLLRRTYGLQHGTDLRVGKTMMVALAKENIEPAIVNIMDNLYFLPSSKDLKNYPDFLEMKFMPDKEKILAGNSTALRSEMAKVKEKRIAYFSKQLAKVHDQYDFIIIDVPPTLSIFTDSAMYATNFVIIVLQTQQRSLNGAETFFEYLQEMYNNYANIDFDIIGILAVLLKNNAGLDSQILKDARVDFGDDMLFNRVIRHMERLKRYDRTGVAEKGLTEYDMHDTRLHYVYTKLTDEIIARLKDKRALN